MPSPEVGNGCPRPLARNPLISLQGSAIDGKQVKHRLQIWIFRKIISLCYRLGMAYLAYPRPADLRNELSESL
jgi:hypothetical protein